MPGGRVTAMKTFMAIFTGTADKIEAFRKLPEQERAKRDQAGLKAWNDWGTKYATAIVDNGAPLGKTKRVTADGISDIRNNMAAYTVVRAESHEEAAKLFLDHPHFTIFPGDGVEIMECLPIPGQ